MDNGLVVLGHEKRHLPIVSLNLFIRAGKDQNPLEDAGIASLTIRMLDEGTAIYSAQQLSEKLEDLGAELSTFSEKELSGVCIVCRSDQLKGAFALLSEMIRRPTFPADRLEIERRNVINHVRATSDDPQVVGSQILSSSIYRGTPLAEPVLGRIETLERFSCEDLHSFYSTKIGPQNSLLVASGDLSMNDIKGLAEEYFSDWENVHLKTTSPGRFERQTVPVKLEKVLDKEQVTIFLGHLGISRTNPDFYALQVLDVILGGGPGFTSRIPRKLRDELGLAYETFADIAGSSGVFPGRFVAYISTSSEKRQQAVRGLRDEIEDLLESGVSEIELETAHKFLTGNFVFEFQSNTSIARFLLMSEVFKLGSSYIKEYPGLIRSVHREDVLRVAREYLDTINYTSVFVGSI